jgi:hypothetical protein
MNIVARISGRNSALQTILEQKNIRFTNTKKAIIVYLPEEKKGEYIVPEEIINMKKYIYLPLKETSAEFYAQIICTPQGEPIIPYYRKGKNAYFAIKWAATIIYASKDKKGRINLCAETVRMKRAKNKIRIIRQELFDETSELPHAYNRYEKAVNAAISKMNCSNCNEPHYIKTK